MKKRILLLLKIAISSVLLWVLLRRTSFEDIFAVIGNARIDMVLYSILFTLGMTYVAAAQFAILTRRQQLRLPVLTIMKINLVSQFYSLFLPGYLAGGAVKWYKMQQAEKKTGAESLVAIVINRFSELSFVLIVGILAILPDLVRRQQLRGVIVVLSVLCALAVCIVLLFSRQAVAFLKNIILGAVYIPVRVKTLLEKLFFAAEKAQEIKLSDTLSFVSLLLLRHSLGVCSIYFFIVAIDINLTFFALVWIRSVSILITMLPISFAGIGVRDGVFVLLMGQYGVLPASSLALSFLILFRTVLMGLLGGVCDLYDAVVAGRRGD